jgi:acetate kinase
LLKEQRQFVSHKDVVEALLDAPEWYKLPQPVAIGHRVVHGGPQHSAPERITARLLAQLRTLIPLARQHLPAQLEVMQFTAAAMPALPQVACFDTAFHNRMPELAQRLPLPRKLWDDGLRRYGFHGLSFEYIVLALGESVKSASVIAHLGNGASLAAVRDGQPVDTTMGLTPSGGLMMGTRSGDLDPGVLLYLLNEQGLTPDELARLVEEQAGLKGVSGISSDMQELLEASPSQPHAAQAIALFCYTACKHIGAMSAALGGLDTLVFTGGIGERAALIRELICRNLAFMGVTLDVFQNARHADTISSAGSRVSVRVIPSDEDLMIARHTYDLVFK